MSVSIKLKIVIGKKTPLVYLDNDVIRKCPKHHLDTRIELDNNDFRNQHTRVSKNTYVAKTQTKMPLGVTFWFPVSVY